MQRHDRRKPYRPLTLARLAQLLVGSEDVRRWRLVAEFLEEYRWEPPGTRLALLARVDALVHAPAAFRRRGVYVAAQELEVA